MDKGCHILLVRALGRGQLGGRFILRDSGCRHTKDEIYQLGMGEVSLWLVRALRSRTSNRKLWGLENEVRHQETRSICRNPPHDQSTIGLFSSPSPCSVHLHAIKPSISLSPDLLSSVLVLRLSESEYTVRLGSRQ